MKAIYFFFTLFISINTFSQNYLVEYDSREQDNHVIVSQIFNDSISYLKLNVKEKLNINNDVFFIKNKHKNICYTKDRFMNIIFNISDSLNNFNWELQNDTAIILDQKCLSAKTNFRGRTYIAYYSSNIKTSDGPWKFCGLPGLILSVKSLDNYLEYNAVKIIENYKEAIETFEFEKYHFLNYQNFVNEYKKSVAKYFKLIQSNGTLKEGSSLNLKIPNREIFYPELQLGEGLNN